MNHLSIAADRVDVKRFTEIEIVPALFNSERNEIFRFIDRFSYLILFPISTKIIDLNETYPKSVCQNYGE